MFPLHINCVVIPFCSRVNLLFNLVFICLQAQIMLGMVTPQMVCLRTLSFCVNYFFFPLSLFDVKLFMLHFESIQLQMPNVRPTSVPFSRTSLQGNHQNQQSAPTASHGLPPMAPLTSAPQNSCVANQCYAPMQFPTQARAQVPNLTQTGGS